MSNEYEEFLESLMESKEKRPIMTHLPSSIKLACKFFPGYLSDEELQERQYSGRYWDIRRDIDGGHILFIVLDNQDILCVTKEEHEECVEAVLDRGYAINFLPDSLRGMYYND